MRAANLEPIGAPVPGSSIASSATGKTTVILSHITPLLLAAIYLYLLYLNLTDVLGDLYGYTGLSLKENISPVFSLVGGTISCLLVFVLPKKFEKPSVHAVWLLYLAVIAPTLTFGFHFTESADGEFTFFLLMLTLSFLLFVLLIRLPTPPIPTLAPPSGLLFWSAVAVASVMALVVRFTLFPFDPSDLTLTDIYDRRLDARGMLESGTLLAYVMGSMNSFLIPVCTLALVGYRFYIFLPIVVLLVIAQFSYDGQKLTLIIPFAIWGLTWISKAAARVKAVLLLLAVTLLTAGSLMEYHALGSSQLGSTIVRRGILIPARLTAAYYDYFSVEGPSFFAGTRLAMIFRPEETLVSPRQIGYYVSDSYEMNANANIFASGYSELGFVGLFLMPLIGALLLKVIDLANRPDRHVIPVYAAFWCGFVWINQSLHTSILSSGIALAVLAALFGPTDRATRSIWNWKWWRRAG